jgi:hypothetical protein
VKNNIELISFDKNNELVIEFHNFIKEYMNSEVENILDIFMRDMKSHYNGSIWDKYLVIKDMINEMLVEKMKFFKNIIYDEKYTRIIKKNLKTKYVKYLK